MLTLLIRYINKIKAMLRQLHALSRFMSDGKYIFDYTISYLFFDNEVVTMKAENLLDIEKGIGLKQVLKKAAAILLNVFLKPYLNYKAENKKIFEGNLILPGVNNRDTKIFDFMNSRVLILFSDRNVYYAKINNYLYFNTYFPIPCIFLKNNTKNILIEELLEYKPYEKWTYHDKLYVINDVFQKQINYLRAAEAKKDYKKMHGSKLIKECNEGNPITELLLSKINPQVLDMEVPLIKLHGDLWCGNLLLLPDCVYYIDWEYSDYLVFFFDLFFIIFSELFLNHDSMYIDMYYRRKFDSEFSKAFQIFGLQFCEHFRADYLYIMMLNHYTNSWKYEDSDVQKDVYRRLKQVTNKLSGLTV